MYWSFGPKIIMLHMSLSMKMHVVTIKCTKRGPQVIASTEIRASIAAIQYNIKETGTCQQFFA